MEEIYPEGSATGAYALEGGNTLSQAVVEANEDQDISMNGAGTTLVVPPLPLPAINPSDICSAQHPSLAVNAVASTTVTPASNSFHAGISLFTLANHPSPQSSNKHPLMSLLPDEMDESLLFSPAIYPFPQQAHHPLPSYNIILSAAASLPARASQVVLLVGKKAWQAKIQQAKTQQ